MILITGSIKEQMIYLSNPINDRPWPTVGLVMYRCLRNGPSSKPTLCWRLVSYGTRFQPEYSIKYAVYKKIMHFVCGWPSFACMNVWLNCRTCRFKRRSEVLLNWSKTAFVNTVYKLFRRLFSYTRLNAKLGFCKTSFVNTAVRH